MAFFHDYDHVRPPQLAGGYLDARAFFGPGRAHLPARVVFKNRLRRQAAPPVAAANKQDFRPGIVQGCEQELGSRLWGLGTPPDGAGA